MRTVKKVSLIAGSLLLLAASATPAKAGLFDFFSRPSPEEQYQKKLAQCEKDRQAAEAELDKDGRLTEYRKAQKESEDCPKRCPPGGTDLESSFNRMTCLTECQTVVLDGDMEFGLAWLEVDYEDCVAEAREGYLAAGGTLSAEEQKELEEYREEEGLEELEDLLDQEVEPEEEQEEEKEDIRELEITNLSGESVKDLKVKIRHKDSSSEIIDLKDGKMSYDHNNLARLVVFDPGTKEEKLTLSRQFLTGQKAIIDQADAWVNHLLTKGQDYAQILNEGQPVNLEDHFKINPNAESDAYIAQKLLKFFFKDKVNFNAQEMVKGGDISTAAHELLGHALTEAIGEGNKLKYAGAGDHDMVWEPGYKERWFLARWLTGKKYKALPDEAARGLAFSEGWAQYVGDKWNRELSNTPDEKSELTVATAKKAIVNGKTKGEFGALYTDQPKYGAKVENVVATFFNEFYKGKSLEDVVKDYAVTRKAYKADHGNQNFQDINQFIAQKLKTIKDQKEIDKINNLIKELELE